MVIHLDPLFTPFPDLEVLPYQYFIFPGGEPHIKIDAGKQRRPDLLITCRIRSFRELGKLMLCVDACNRLGFKRISLFLPYFPGARQDRINVAGEALTLKIYADVINGLNFERVYLFDPHSAQTQIFLNNCCILNNHLYINKVLKTLPLNTLLVSPDAGAHRKLNELKESIRNIEIIKCTKQRNVETGKLSGFNVEANDLGQRPCLIVDDICDGGGTFLGIAKKLKEKNAGTLYLAVSHGIFSKGIDELLKFYTKIYTTDSFYSIITDEGLQQMELEDCIEKSIFNLITLN